MMNRCNRIKLLREKSGCGLEDCARAFRLMGEDYEIALVYLKNKGQAVVRKFTGKPLPIYGHQMEIGEFIKSCNSGEFIDYDGHGYYATKDQISDILIQPSDITKHKELVQTWFTHIVWFNR